MYEFYYTFLRGDKSKTPHFPTGILLMDTYYGSTSVTFFFQIPEGGQKRLA
jgi:hypothetical protein